MNNLKDEKVSDLVWQLSTVTNKIVEHLCTNSNPTTQDNKKICIVTPCRGTFAEIRDKLVKMDYNPHKIFFINDSKYLRGMDNYILLLAENFNTLSNINDIFDVSSVSRNVLILRVA